jgi:hypothetical protein
VRYARATKSGAELYSEVASRGTHDLAAITMHS